MTRILVAGAGGYIGIPLCEGLVNKGYEVAGLDTFAFGLARLGRLLDHPRLTPIQADIRDFDLSVLEGIDAVIDLAGFSTDAAADIDPELTRQIHIEGGLRLARAAKKRGIKRYLYSSSAAVYGAGEKEALTESDELRPQTAYARIKLQFEEQLLSLQDDSFEVVILRLATLFGLAPRMRFDIAVNIMTLRAWRDHEIHVGGGGRQWRPLVHVQDVVRALILILEEDAAKVSGEIFNVGSNGMNFRVSEIAQAVSDVIPDVTVHNNDDTADKLSYNLSFNKIADRLGFETTMSVPDGVTEVLQALEGNLVSGSDPTCYTADWYRSLTEHEAR
jgi:nucleoside-diphosphate-sugar epimerase